MTTPPSHEDALRMFARVIGAPAEYVQRRRNGTRWTEAYALPCPTGRGDVTFDGTGGWLTDVTPLSDDELSYGDPYGYAIYLPNRIRNSNLIAAWRAVSKGGDDAAAYSESYLPVPSLEHVIQRLLGVTRATEWPDAPPHGEDGRHATDTVLDFAFEARVEPTLDLAGIQATFRLHQKLYRWHTPTLLAAYYSFSSPDADAVGVANRFILGQMPAYALIDRAQDLDPGFADAVAELSGQACRA